MKRRKSIVTYFVLGILLMCGCSFGGSKKEGKTAEENNFLNLVIASEPPALDPAIATDVVSVGILTNTFEGLTRVDKDNNLQNALAEKITVSDDGLTYTFELRDANWSNGEKITAEDFEYSWKRVLNPETLSEYAANLYVIKGAEDYNINNGKEEDVQITAVDERTLEVVLNDPTAYFTQLTATHTYLPVNKKVVEENKNWATDAGDNYVSNGAFVMGDWKHDDSIKLDANKEYWDSSKVNLDYVNIKMVEDESTANKMYEASEIDFLGMPFQQVPLDAIDGYKTNNELNSPNYANAYYYKVNTTKEFVSNKNIRKALALSIDRQNIVDNITKAGQIVATGTVPPVIKGFEDQNDFFKDNDVKEAQKYLADGMAELGLSSPSDITVDISVNTSEMHGAIAQVIQESWKKNLGINSSIDNSDWKVFLDKVSSLNYSGVARMGWTADYLDAITFLDLFETKETGTNQTGWENDTYKQLLEESRKEKDEEKRLVILKEAQKILIDDMPIIPIYYNVNTYVVKDYVKDMVPNGLGILDLKTVNIEK